MAKKQVQAERTWLGIAVAFLLAGASMIATADSPRLCDPFLYVGATLGLVAVWILAGVFVTSRVLPKLPSEKAAERLQRGLDDFSATGYELLRRRVTSDAELATLTTDYAGWVQAARAWLAREVSEARASKFQYASGMAADVIGSYNGDHVTLRLNTTWRLDVLQELEREAQS